MDVTTLELIVNIITWGSLGLLILLVVILFFAGLIGWKRGIFNAGFRLIFISILIIVALTTVRPMVEFIGARDMGPLLRLFGMDGVTMEVGSNSVSIQVTSIFETLTNLIIALAESNGITIASDQVEPVVHGLVYLILSTFVVIMDGFLISTLGNLGATILWHALFKHLISKRVRKAVRVKGVAALMGATQTLVVGAMLIFPFSALINNVTAAFKNEDNGIVIDNEMINTVTTIVDAYEDSVLANVLFNWTNNSEGQSWDVMLMDSLTSADVNGLKVSFIDEIYNLVGIGKTLTSAGIFSEDGMSSIGQTILANDEMVVSLLSSIGNSGLVLMLIPVAVELALNLDVVKQYVGEDLIDISDIDWKDEINNIGKMYKAVQSTGLFDDLFDEEGNAVLDADALKNIFELDTYSGMMGIFKAIDDSKLLSRAIPAVAYTMSKNNEQIAEFSSFLPTEWEDFTAIRWGSELSIVYDALFRLNALDDTLLDSLMNMGGDEGGEPESEPEPAVKLALQNASLGAPYKSEQDINNLLLDEEPEESESNPLEPLLRNAGAIKEILVGRSDANGNPIGVDANGITKVFDDDGNRLYNRHYALFDSQLLQYSLSGAITYLVESLLVDFDLTSADFDGLIDDLNTGVKLLNYKKEYGAVLDLMVALGENDATRALVLDFENMPGIVFKDDGSLESIDPELVDGLKIALPKIDNSRLLSLIFPSLLENTFAGEDMAGMFDAVGIDATRLNWQTPRLGREFSMLIDAFDSVQELMGIMEPYQDEGGEVPATSFGALMLELSENDEPLAKMLDTLYSSNIINEKYQEDIYNTFGVLLHSKGEMVYGNDSNFFAMLDFVFESLLEGRGFTNKKDVYNVAQWTNSRTLNGDFRRDHFGDAIYDGETGFMTNFISSIGRTGLLDIIDVEAGDNIDYGELGAAVSEVFDAVEQSAVFSATFGDVLDMFVLDQLSDDPGDVSFNNVSDWSLEGEAFERLCLAIDDFGDIDFADIDFIGSDPDNVVELLSALADSQMFDGPSGYLFGDFFYDQLMTSLGSNTEYFYDPNATTTNEVKEDFDSLETRPDWQFEIVLFGEALEALQNSNVDSLGNPIDTGDPVDYLGLLTTGKVTADNVHNILTALNNTTTMRMIIYNGYNQIATAFQSDEIDLSTMNNVALVDMSKTQRQDEIDVTVQMYRVIENMGTQDSGTGEYTYDINLRDAADEEIDDLRVALDGLVSSVVFNSLDDDSLPADETVFKQFTRFFMRGPVIEEAIFRPENPKDIDGVSHGYYTDGPSKTTYLLNTNFPTPTVNTNMELVFDVVKTESAQKGYVGEMMDLVDVMVNLDASGGDPYDAEGIDVEYELLDEVDFENILNALNDSELLYDCVPNMISRIINDEAAFDIDDIELGAANPFFHYNGTTFTNRFPTGEISELSDLFILIQDFSSLVATGDIDLNLIASELTLFKDTLVALQETETFYLAGSYMLSEITVFEQIMRKIYTDTYLAELSYNRVFDFDASVTSISEGIIQKITDSILDFPNFVNPLHGDSLHNGNWVTEIDAIGDLITAFNGLGMASGDFSGLSVDTLTPSDLSMILQSINALDNVKDAVPYMIKDALYNENINFNRFSTYNTDVYNLNATLLTLDGTSGNINLTGNNTTVVGSQIDFLAGGSLYNTDPINNICSLQIETSAAIDDFQVFYGNAVNPTTNFYLLDAAESNVYTIDLSCVPYQYFRIEAVTNFTIDDIIVNQATESGNYMQNQVSYRDTNIPILINLMDEFFVDSSSTYYDFSQPEGVVGFVNDGNSTGPILAFIVDSDLYQDPITPDYKGESIFLYNILSFKMDLNVGGVPVNLDTDLAHNVRGALMDDKLSKLDDIINDDDGGKFDALKEGDAIDYGLFAMSFMEGSINMPTAKTAFVSAQDYYLYNIANYDDGSGVVNFIDLAVGSSSRGVVDSNFLLPGGYGHSLLISEIVAGQINDILNNKYAYLDGEAIVYTPVDLYSGVYVNLDDAEKLGFSGAINALYYSLNDLLVPNSEMTEAEITAAFESMYGSDIAMIFYLADIYPCLSGNILAGGRGLAVNPNPTTLTDWQNIAALLIADRGY
ncbi:MAG: hypothetical protein WCX85_00590 [Bacilli bacterium]